MTEPGDIPLQPEGALVESLNDLETQVDHLLDLLEKKEEQRQALEKRITQLLPRIGFSTVCNGPHCGARIYMVTLANGKKAPYDPDGVPHFGTCPDSTQFRRKP